PAHRRSLTLADKDEHVSADHRLDDSEGRSSDRPIEGSETATMFEPNSMRDETSDAVSRNPEFPRCLGASLVHCARHFGGLHYRVRRCHLARATLAPPRRAIAESW